MRFTANIITIATLAGLAMAAPAATDACVPENGMFQARAGVKNAAEQHSNDDPLNLGAGEEVNGVNNCCKALIIHEGKCLYPKDIPGACVGRDGESFTGLSRHAKSFLEQCN